MSATTFSYWQGCVTTLPVIVPRVDPYCVCSTVAVSACLLANGAGLVYVDPLSGNPFDCPPGTAYNVPAAATTGSPFTAGNLAIIEGFIRPLLAGNLAALFASENGNAITLQTGANVEWSRIG